jgi:hypothetical protein
VLSGSSVQLNVDEIKKSWLKAALYLVPNAWTSQSDRDALR